jgi:hypothetical protein
LQGLCGCRWNKSLSSCSQKKLVQISEYDPPSSHFCKIKDQARRLIRLIHEWSFSLRDARWLQ